ncbi:hypothetical protein ACWGIB_27480 [Streptomyces xiamenensis]
MSTQTVSTSAAFEVTVTTTPAEPCTLLRSRGPMPAVDVTVTTTCRLCSASHAHSGTGILRDMWEILLPKLEHTLWLKPGQEWVEAHAGECPLRPLLVEQYLTVGGATVDIKVVPESGSAAAECGGCPSTMAIDLPYISGDIESARRWAQAHAEKCRALPKPEVSR